MNNSSLFPKKKRGKCITLLALSICQSNGFLSFIQRCMLRTSLLLFYSDLTELPWKQELLQQLNPNSYSDLKMTYKTTIKLKLRKLLLLIIIHFLASLLKIIYYNYTIL